MNGKHHFRMEANSRGAVAPTVALSLFALIGAGGIAFDYARMASLDTELQNAADQAALAAASQLDHEDGACERAVAAARDLLVNQTVMGNDGGGLAVTIADSGVCQADTTIVDDPDATVRFFQNKITDPDDTDYLPATDDSNANFVMVTVDERKAKYALTPVVGAIESGDLKASAVAGLGTALCKVPPLMVCPPDNEPEDWNTWAGHGIRALSNSKWSPGGFGYIGPQDAGSTQIAMAFENPVFQCQQITGEQPVSTGQPAPGIVAMNSRFDIYDMSGGAGQVLTPCFGSACPPALNVTKDLMGPKTGNSCKTDSSGWRLPAANRRFFPVVTAGTDPMRKFQKSGQPIDAMGLPRDNVHYCSYSGSKNCPKNDSQFGDGVWARGDYFNKYHAADITAGLNPSTWTRYQTYLWEISEKKIPNSTGADTLVDQRGKPVCNATIPDASRDRRVLQVAIGGNCGDLKGASTPVQIKKWVEMFLVEPGTSATNKRGNGDEGNEIYLEVIREVDPGGAAPQVVRRDSPYLVR